MMALRFFSTFVLLLFFGCKSVDSSSDDTDSTNSNTSTICQEENNSNIYMPKPATSWQWQLSGTINTEYDVDIYDIDLFNSSKELISSLKNSGKKVICYFSAGSWESFREDKDVFPLNAIGKTLEGWEDEKWLDITNESVKEIMKKRLDLAKEKGCDGVEPDNVDGYVNDSGFDISYQDQLEFNKFIAKEAHKRNLSVGLKNDLNQVKDLVCYFDFAVNEECYEYNECEKLKPFIDNNKAVLNVEYNQEYLQTDKIKEVCEYLNDMNFSSLIMPLDLDDSFRYDCKDY